MKRRVQILTAAAACLCAAALLVWAGERGYFLPSWIEWQERELTCDGAAITLTRRRVTFCADGSSVWRSDRALRVQDVLWCDIDHDGEEELLLLCWKRGRYGASRPFWVKKDSRTWSQHIFIYDRTGEGTLRPIWMASDLQMDVARWSFSPETRLALTDRAGRTTGWDWISWGLTGLPGSGLAGDSGGVSTDCLKFLFFMCEKYCMTLSNMV